MLEKSIGFAVQIQVIFKKKEKKGHLFISYFSVGFQKKGKEREKGVWVGMLNILRGQNCPKSMKLPKILTRDRHLKTKRGVSAPPAPLPSTPLILIQIDVGLWKQIAACCGNRIELS